MSHQPESNERVYSLQWATLTIAPIQTLKFSSHDMVAVAAVLRSYLKYLYVQGALLAPPNPQIAVLHHLQRCIQVTEFYPSAIVPLSLDDINALSAAVEWFLESLRRRVPESLERRGVEESLTHLQNHLRQMAGPSHETAAEE